MKSLFDTEITLAVKLIQEKPITLTGLFFLIFFHLPSTDAIAQSYIKCWTNELGQTECGNRIPREHYSRQVRFIDEQGITRKVKERDKTPEELAIEKENQRILDAQLEHEKKLKEYDDILFKTYLTVDDLINALNSKLGILDSRISVIESIIENRQEIFDELVKKAADIERSGNEIPDNLKKQLQITRSEIRNLESQLDSEQKESLKIQKTYTHDVERFMVTTTNRLFFALEKPELARKYNAVRLSCSSDKQCDSYWLKAKKYVESYSSTPVRYTNEKIVVTDTPNEQKNIAMCLTYLDEQDLQEKDNGRYIVLQLRCKQGRAGEELCQGDNVSNLLREFKSEMYY